MTVLNALFTLSEGVIIEPVTSENIGYWEYLFAGQASNANPGFLIALGLLVLSGIASAAMRSWLPLAVFGVIAAALTVIAIVVSVPQYNREQENPGYEANLIAEQLSEHYSLKITEQEVRDSGLIEQLTAGDSISQLEYSSTLTRDTETGEWAKSINYFIVDGKVIELYSEAAPLEGDFKTSKN